MPLHLRWRWYYLQIVKLVWLITLTNFSYSASRMRLNEQAPETSLGAEVYHQASMVINTHAGRIQCTWQKYIQTHQILPKRFLVLIYVDVNESRNTNCNSLLYSHHPRNLPWSSACGGLPMPSFQRMAVSYTKVSRSSDCRSKCCQPPVPTGEWNTYDT